MRKFIIAIVVLAVFAAGVPVFAQSSDENEDDFYYINLTLEKIWPYRAGYVVQYRKGINRIGRLYLPNEWFSSSAGKGEIIKLPPGLSWPSLSVYYKNGEFSHVRLYVHRVNTHSTWGVVPQNVNIDSSFDNVDTLKIDFK